MRPLSGQSPWPPALLYRKSHDLAKPLSASYPATMAISSSVNPYNSYTSPSICWSVASACGVALEHGLDVRRLPRPEDEVAAGAPDQKDHPVVPRDVVDAVTSRAARAEIPRRNCVRSEPGSCGQSRAALPCGETRPWTMHPLSCSAKGSQALYRDDRRGVSPRQHPTTGNPGSGS